jgi:hypothetical protein
VRRLFWVVVGVGLGAVVGVAIIRSAQRTKERYSPSGIANRAGEAGNEFAARLSEAIEEGRKAMAEKEAELRADLGLDGDRG